MKREVGTRVENTKRNIIYSLACRLVKIICPFISRSFLIYILGIEYVGLSSLFTSILGVLNIAELGVGSAIVYSMYEPIEKGDDVKVRALLLFYRKCYRIVAIVVMVVGIICMPFLNQLTSGEVPEGEHLELLFFASLANVVISYLMYAYKSAIFTASQRIDICERINMGIALLSTLLQCVVLVLFSNYMVFVIVTPFMTVISNLLTARLAEKYYPQYYCEGNLAIELLSQIKKSVSGLIVQKIGNVVLTSVDSIVISSFLGLVVLGKYNNYYMIMQAVVTIVTILYSSMIPSIGNSMITQSKETVYEGFRKYRFIYTFVLIWATVFLVCLVQPFMKIWVGEDNTFSTGVAFCFGIYFFVHHVGDFSHAYKEAAGIWWPGRFVVLISSLINLILNLGLVKYLGIYGILISTIVAIAFVNIPFGGKVLFQHYFKDMKKWGRYCFDSFYYLIVTAVVTIVTYFVCTTFVSENEFIVILFRLIVCAILPVVILVGIFFWTKDFKAAKKFVYEKVLKK